MAMHIQAMKTLYVSFRDKTAVLFGPSSLEMKRPPTHILSLSAYSEGNIRYYDL